MPINDTLIQQYLKRKKLCTRDLWRRVSESYHVSEARMGQVVRGERPSPQLAAAIALVTGISREKLIYDAIHWRKQRQRRRGNSTGRGKP